MWPEDRLHPAPGLAHPQSEGVIVTHPHGEEQWFIPKRNWVLTRTSDGARYTVGTMWASNGKYELSPEKGKRLVLTLDEINAQFTGEPPAEEAAL